MRIFCSVLPVKQNGYCSESLIKVNGVGPKLALTILSGQSVIEFYRCVDDNDVKSLVRLPGVGQKTAERLIIEMRGRLPEINTASTLPLHSAKSNGRRVPGRKR